MPISPEAARNALFRTDDDQTRTPTKRCPNGSVTKADLLSEVKQGVNNKRIEDNRTVLTDNDVKDVYDVLLIVISNHLQAGECVNLRSIGSIVMKDTGTLGIATSSVFSELRKEKTAERARLRKEQNARRIKHAEMMPDGVYNFESDPQNFFTPPKTAMSAEKMEKYIQNAQKKLRNELLKKPRAPLTKEEAKAKRNKSAADKKNEIIARQGRYWNHPDPETYTVTPPKESQYPKSWATKTQKEKEAWLKKWEDDRFEEILKAIGRKTDKQKDDDKAKRAEEKTARIERRINRPDAINSISPRDDILDPAKRAKVRMQAVLELQREMANRAKNEASAEPESKRDKQLRVIGQLQDQLEDAKRKSAPLAKAAQNLLDGLSVDANKHSYEYLLQVQTARSLAKEAERTVKNLTAKLDKKMTEMSSPNTHIAVKRAKKPSEPTTKKLSEPTTEPTEQTEPTKPPKTAKQPKPPKNPVQKRKSARLAQ